MACEIEGEGADELPRDDSHLTLRAFALFAPAERYRFSFVNRVPLERGLGSSRRRDRARARRRRDGRRQLDEAGRPARGRRCHRRARGQPRRRALRRRLLMKRNGTTHAARIAADLPRARSSPSRAARTRTTSRGAACPRPSRTRDAAHDAARPRCWAQGSRTETRSCSRDAFDDRLHEQYRAPTRRSLRRCGERAGPAPSASRCPARALGRRLGRARPCRGGRAALEAPLPEDTKCSPSGSRAQEPTPYERLRTARDPAKRHSAALTDGVDRAPARAMLKGVGFTDADLAGRWSASPRRGSRRCRATSTSGCSPAREARASGGGRDAARVQHDRHLRRRDDGDRRGCARR